jgi:hypothetical protein
MFAGRFNKWQRRTLALGRHSQFVIGYRGEREVPRTNYHWFAVGTARLAVWVLSSVCAWLFIAAVLLLFFHAPYAALVGEYCLATFVMLAVVLFLAVALLTENRSTLRERIGYITSIDLWFG